MKKAMIRRFRCAWAGVMLLLCQWGLSQAPVAAQQSAFEVQQQRMALLPSEVESISLVDGNLYSYAAEVLLVAQRAGMHLMGFTADTLYVNMADGVRHVVKHPQTGDVYFTAINRKGRSLLYCCKAKEGRLGRPKKVNLGGMDVEHPVFSTDGSLLVFASMSGQKGQGGYDLWCADWSGGKLSRPHNMGSRINTPYDELSPTMYRDFLLFSSNGHHTDHAYLDVCATRLFQHVTGDSVVLAPSGLYPVQRLPEPINSSDANDFDVVIDTSCHVGYIVSRRAESDSDSQLYSFVGDIEGTLMWGRVSSKAGQGLAGIAVRAAQNGATVCTTTTDSAGFYQLYLLSDQFYEVSYRADGYFVNYEAVNTAKADNATLVAEQRLDVEMKSLSRNVPIRFDNLYGPDADIELSDYGREQLAPLVQFLNDNPQSSVSLSLMCDLTDSRNFNLLLTGSRLQSLEEYIYPLIPSSVTLDFRSACAGAEGCASATGRDQLTVILH